MAYREIRVRPVVRYIITEFTCDDDMKNQSSQEWGEFDNVHKANVMANSMRSAEHRAGENGAAPGPKTVVEECPSLRIRWERGPGEAKEATRWRLEEAD